MFSYSEEAAPTLHTLIVIMKLHRILDIVRERLVDELVKEMLKDRYTIVSACYKEKDGKKIRKRKAHVRRRH